MIPILYKGTETAFEYNGLGRLRDCISCIVTEERNGIYECDFEYPVTGRHFSEINLGSIIGVTHDSTGDVQPFDIVSMTRPIKGIVSFHAVHISYRQSFLTAYGSNINSLADAFNMLSTSTPANPFTYSTDKTSTGFLSSADGLPKTVKSYLGGTEGSILDVYGGEYKFDKFNVELLENRGRYRDFKIRYGVNMIDYNDEANIESSYSSCIPFWNGGDVSVVGGVVTGDDTTVTGRGECVPLDLSDKFEEQPTTAQLESMAANYLNYNKTALPVQTINVSFLRIQELDGFEQYESLLDCGLCDSIQVVFPMYNTQATFKIVKTVYNVLRDRFDSMELGQLATTLSEALGIQNSLGGGTREGPVIGQVYSTGWTATRTSSLDARVTGDLRLPKGTYICFLKVPVASQTVLFFEVFAGSANTNHAGNVSGAGQGVFSCIVELSQDTTVYGVAKMSTDTTYTYTERGYLKALRIK